MLVWPLPKDPDDVCDYQFDWSERLETGETIETSTFTVDEGSLTIEDFAVSGALTTFWASEGVHGTTVVVTNRIVTSGGREYDASSKLRIRSTS